MAFMDAGIDLICAISLSTVGQVICYTPPSSPDQVFPSQITNWGLNGGGDTNGVPIAPNTTPIAVAIVKDTSQPKRRGGGYYAVTVLLSDSTVMVTFGNSDQFYQGDNFATYQPFVSPVTTDGEPLSLKKIIWMNEDAGVDSTLPGPVLWALSNDNKLYYDAGGVWGFDSADVRDVGRIASRGMTVVYTDNSIGYYDFQEGGYGWLPSPPSEEVVAIGGLYALTDAGCGGDCSDDNPTFCAGDDRRILHFNWLEWKWETFEDQLAEAGASVANYYPFAPPNTCSGCSPQMTDSIVDPHGFGSNNDGPHFDVGPFVYWAGGRRIQFYDLPGGLPGQFHWCDPSSFSSCYVTCGTQLDGTPCLQTDGTPGACRGTAAQCQPCGDLNQAPCPGLDCSKVAGGGLAIAGFCRQLFQVGNFGGEDWGFSACDWDPFRTKATCPGGAVVAGLSFDAFSGQTHDVLCRESRQVKWEPTCDETAIDQPGNEQRGNRIGDWDPGYYKLECGEMEFAAGVDQGPDGGFGGILCGNQQPLLPGTWPGPCRVIPAADANYSGAGDWDFGFIEASCSDDEYVAGVSVSTSEPVPHALLCCAF